MKKIRIAINGFGRIGRLVLRACTNRRDVDVVAINDPFIDLNYAKYLFTHDTIHGHFNGLCEVKGERLRVENFLIAFYSQMDPALIPWHKHKVDVVIEASGKFTK